MLYTLASAYLKYQKMICSKESRAVPAGTTLPRSYQKVSDIEVIKAKKDDTVVEQSETVDDFVLE